MTFFLPIMRDTHWRQQWLHNSSLGFTPKSSWLRFQLYFKVPATFQNRTHIICVVAYVLLCFGSVELTHGVGLSGLLLVQQDCMRAASTPAFTGPTAHATPERLWVEVRGFAGWRQNSTLRGQFQFISFHKRVFIWMHVCVRFHIKLTARTGIFVTQNENSFGKKTS